jgi:hypothetical protein
MIGVQYDRFKNKYAIIEILGKNKEEVIYTSNNIDNIVSYLNTKYR